MAGAVLNFFFTSLNILCYNQQVAAPIQVQRGGAPVSIFESFIVSVTAGVVCHYILKWLDGDV